LQILPDVRLAQLQKKQYRTIIELPARRGNLLDRSGKELAVSVPSYSLFADPKLIKDPHRWAAQVSKISGSSYREILKKVKPKDKRFVWIQRRMSESDRDKIKKLNLSGIGFVEEAKRIYPNNALLSQVIGFLSRDDRGVEGIEKKFDKELRGEKHAFHVERDARGRPLLIDGRIFAEVPAGADLTLTIDSEMQFVLEKSLYDTVVTHNADSAMGIVLDAKTSEVLAMGYAPTYDLNRARSFGSNFWRNKIATDSFEPGSVVKTILIAGALRENLVKPSTKFYCEDGKFKIGKRTIREADAHHNFGYLSVSEILAKSSNIGAAKIAFEMGPQLLKKTMVDFGLTETLSEDFVGESKGIMQAMPWSQHLQAAISFGHGIATTPLQIAAAYAAIASDGILRRPYIVKSMHSWDTSEEKVFEPKEIRRVLSKSEASTMRLMLNQATEEGGTGIPAQVPGFPVAGKTGTAQKVSATGGYSKNEYISSFAGMIPANDPKYVIYVAVDNPRDKYYGAEVAAPLFSRMASFAVRKSGLAPVRITKRNVVPIQKAKKSDLSQRLQAAALVLNETELNRTPDLKGLTLREVYQRVKGADLEINAKGNGRVADMIPSAGDPLPSNKTIRIILRE
jgi:cell division protein FtsI (penicillin-binding protein 3)